MSDSRLEAPVCHTCGATASPFWKRHKMTGNILCSECYKTDKNSSAVSRTPSPLVAHGNVGSAGHQRNPTHPAYVGGSCNQRDHGASLQSRTLNPAISPQLDLPSTRSFQLFPRDLSNDFGVVKEVGSSVATATTARSSERPSGSGNVPDLSVKPVPHAALTDSSRVARSASPIAATGGQIKNRDPLNPCQLPSSKSSSASTTKQPATDSAATLAAKQTTRQKVPPPPTNVASTVANRQNDPDSAAAAISPSGSVPSTPAATAAFTDSSTSSSSAASTDSSTSSAAFTDPSASSSQSRSAAKPPSDKLEIQVLKSVDSPAASTRKNLSSTLAATKRVERKVQLFSSTRGALTTPVTNEVDPKTVTSLSAQDNIFKRVAAKELAGGDGARSNPPCGGGVTRSGVEDDDGEDVTCKPRKNARTKNLQEKRAKIAATTAATSVGVTAAVASARKSASSATKITKPGVVRKSVSPLKSKSALIRQKNRALKAKAAAVAVAAIDDENPDSGVADRSESPRKATSRREKLRKKRETLMSNRKRRESRLAAGVSPAKSASSASIARGEGDGDGSRIEGDASSAKRSTTEGSSGSSAAASRLAAKSMPVGRRRNLQTRKSLGVANDKPTSETKRDEGDGVRQGKRRKIHSLKAKETTQMARFKPRNALGKVAKPTTTAAAKRDEKEEKKAAPAASTATAAKDGKPTTAQPVAVAVATTPEAAAALATAEDVTGDGVKTDRGADDMRKARVDARSAATIPIPPKRKLGNGKGASKSKVGRRNLFFKQRGSVVRGTTRVASIISPDIIYYRGQFWQKGDIVSVVDEDDDQVYYAQIRGFIQDQYCEKSAVLTWLLPTLHPGIDRHTQLHPGFHPHAFVSGPEEDLPRKMECLDFVCRAPSDYFKLPAGTHGLAPFPVVGAEDDDPGVFEAQRRKLGFVWIASSSKEDGDEEEEEGGIPTIQPIPSLAQMLLGNDGDELDCS